MLYITMFVMVSSFGNCRDTLPEVGAVMASKMAAVFRRTGLSLGSLPWIFPAMYPIGFTNYRLKGTFWYMSCFVILL